MVEKYIKDKKFVMFVVCFDQLDYIGYVVGYDILGYYEKLKELDGYVGCIIVVIKEVGIYDDMIIMMIVDYGGIKKGYGGIIFQEVEIFFIIVGKNVRKGGEFQESMMQFDIVVIMGYVFGVK